MDESIFKYWTDPDVVRDPGAHKLTTRFILSHRSGFPNWRKGKLSFQYEPRTKYQYSGEGFEYLKNPGKKISYNVGQIGERADL